MFKQLAALVLLGTALTLTACGSDPMDNDDDGPTPDPTYRGFFLDDAVEGLQYSVDGGPVRVTDVYGIFEYELGKDITFLVDGVAVGTTNGADRVTPSNFGSSGTNVARFLQSLDTTPGEPGIDLTGIDLPGTPINFDQSGSAFGNDAAVLAAVAAAAQAGGTGSLVSESAAVAELAAGTSTTFTMGDLSNVAFYPVSVGPDNEPCVARLRSDGTGDNLCRDDIDEDPSAGRGPFTWSIQGSVAVLQFGADERVTVQRLGDTGNRTSAAVVSECLTCDPNVEPVFEAEIQTLVKALPLTSGDLAGRTLSLSGPGASGTATFVADGSGTLDIDGEVATFRWSVGEELNNVLILRGTGSPGSSLLYYELFVMEGSASAGTFAAVLASATDTNSNGQIDAVEIQPTAQYDSIEQWQFQ